MSHERQRRYQATPAGQSTQDRYRTSERGREVSRRAALRHHFKKNYGLTPEGIAEQWAAQGGCLICRGGDKPFVDHDHATGRVRGLLCASCNLGLGKFRDDPELLASASQYVFSHRPLTA